MLESKSKFLNDSDVSVAGLFTQFNLNQDHDPEYYRSEAIPMLENLKGSVEIRKDRVKKSTEYGSSVLQNAINIVAMKDGKMMKAMIEKSINDGELGLAWAITDLVKDSELPESDKRVAKYCRKDLENITNVGIEKEMLADTEIRITELETFIGNIGSVDNSKLMGMVRNETESKEMAVIYKRCYEG